MNGFHAQGPLRHDRRIGKQHTVVLLTGLAVSLSLCMTSGCAITRSVLSGVHHATCGESASRCDCTCGECTAGVHAENGVGYRDPRLDPGHSSAQRYVATPLPPEGSRPITQEIRSQPARLNGMPGTWIPAPSATHMEFEDQSAAYPGGPPSFWPDSESVATSQPPMIQGPSQPQPMQWPTVQSAPAMCLPETKPAPDPLKEYRTQVQILSQQISQMKDAQDHMKASQETLQQSHEREILELKLEQTTADRDRLKRERELELQLEKQRQRELDTFDSLSQFIEDVVPATAPSNAVGVPNPRSTMQSGQVQSMAPTQLPPVDASL